MSPPGGTRFEFPLPLLAQTVDLDVASVQFQFKPAADAMWTDLGPADAKAPYEALLDPAALTPGDYDVRAVATDDAGLADAAPASVGVTLGDTTPPATPADLAALVDGASVQVSWTANGEGDLAGYHVDRDGARLTGAALATPTFADLGRADGFYEYAVVAVDADGNESVAALVSVVVYGLAFDDRFPVVQGASVTLAGGGGRADTTVEITDDGAAVVASAAAEGDRFSVPGVSLAAGVNRLSASGVDAAGNRSRVAGPLTLMSNAPPGPVTGLTANGTGFDVELGWDPVTDSDLFGYLVSRDGERLTGTVPQTTAAEIIPTAGDGTLAFDSDEATTWQPAGSATWTVTFPAPVLVERIEILTGFGLPTTDEYLIEARLAGEYLPLVRRASKSQSLLDYVLDAPVATDSLRLSFGDPQWFGIAEIRIDRIDVVPQGVTSFDDPALADGLYSYEVTALDEYGALGASASTQATVGDVVAPAAPMGLVATVVLSDVALTWAANTEPDLAGYAVLRDGVRVAETTPPTMTDVGLANGGYEYRAIAIDAVGNESPPSTPVTATVAAPVSPPSSPVITGPTDAANPIAQSEITTDVGGFGPPGSDVILEVNGGFAGSGTTGDGGYVEVGATDLPAGAIFRAMARDGSSFVYFGEDGAYLVDTATQLPVELTPASHDEIVYVSYSGDGRKLASLALAFDPITGDEIRDTIFVRDLATGVETIVLDTDAELWEAILSPAGDRLSYVAFGDLGARLRLVDLAAGTDVEIASAGFEIAFTSWSPDDQLIAHARFEIEGDPGQLFLHDTATGLRCSRPTTATRASSAGRPTARHSPAPASRRTTPRSSPCSIAPPALRARSWSRPTCRALTPPDRAWPTRPWPRTPLAPPRHSWCVTSPRVSTPRSAAFRSSISKWTSHPTTGWTTVGSPSGWETACPTSATAWGRS